MAEKINIKIDEAKIDAFYIDMSGEIPEIIVYINLYANKVLITRFSGSTNNWDSSKKFDLTMKMQILIQKIALDLEIVVTALCQSQTKELLC